MNEVNVNRKKLIKPKPQQIDIEKKINTTIHQLLIPNVNDLISNSRHLIHITNKANENTSIISEYKKELKYRYNKIEKMKIEVNNLKESLLLKRCHKEEINNIIQSYLDLLNQNNISINTQLDALQSKEILLTIKEHYINRLLSSTIPTDEESQYLLGDTKNNYTEFNVSQTGFIHNVNNSDCLIDPPLGVTSATNKEDFLNISLTQGNIKPFIQSYNHDRQMFKNKLKPIKKCKSVENLNKQRITLHRLNIKKSKITLKETKQEINPIKKVQKKCNLAVIKKEVPKIKKKEKRNDSNKSNNNCKVNLEQLKAISDKVLYESGINQAIEEFHELNQLSNLFISKNNSSKNKEKQKQKTTSNEEEKNSHSQYIKDDNICKTIKESNKRSGVFKKSNQIEYAHQMLKQYLIESKKNINSNKISNDTLETYNKSNKGNDEFMSMSKIYKSPRPFKSPITDHSKINKCFNIKCNSNLPNKQELKSDEINSLSKTSSGKYISSNTLHKVNKKPQIQFDYNSFIYLLFDKLFACLYIANARVFIYKLQCYEKDYITAFTFKEKQYNQKDNTKAKKSLISILNQYYVNKIFLPSLVNILYCGIQEYNDNQKKDKGILNTLLQKEENYNKDIQKEEKCLDNQTEKGQEINQSTIIKEKTSKINLVKVEDFFEENEAPENINNFTQYENSLNKIKEITKATQEIETKIKSFAKQMLNIP